MKQNRKLTKVLLMVYLLALTWIILFKLQPAGHELQKRQSYPLCGFGNRK